MTRLLAILTTLALVLAACGSTPVSGTTGGAASGTPAAGKPIYGGTITFGLENDVSNLDPMLSGLFVDRNIHYAMYDSLVRVDVKGNIIPWLAQTWTTSTDGKVVTFNLRQGVKYHDGTAFDAASVKWNIERYKNTKGSSRTGDLGAVATVDVVDTYTVKFNLSAAFAPLLAALVDRAGMMVSQKVADAMGADFTLKPFKAGTGPFILTEAVKTDHYTLERHPAHEPSHRPGAGAERHRGQGRPRAEGRHVAHVPGGRLVRVEQHDPERGAGLHLQREALREGGRHGDRPAGDPRQGSDAGQPRARGLWPDRARGLRVRPELQAVAEGRSGGREEAHRRGR